MKQRSLLIVLAFWAVQLAASLSAANQARLFLRSHADKPVQQDELAELKGENPEAYAIVKALLTKRSLGLLNPKHPTASFAPESAEQQEPAKGPEVFTDMMRPGELEAAQTHQEVSSAPAPKVALPYASVQPAAHRDWMNWKPQDSAANDDAMVQNVLGAVAELKGKKAGLLAKRSGDSLASDEASLGVESAPVAAKPVEAAPAPHENSYLKSIDFGIRAPAAPAAQEPERKQENSYLKGLNLDSDAATEKRTSQVQAASTNYLSSFSWDDSKPKEEPKAKVAQPEMKDNGKDHSLLSWLGVVKPAPAPQAVAQPAKPANPYLMDLN